MKLLLFDIDGTLLLTDGLGLGALRAALGQVVGADVALADVKPDGKTDPLIVAELLHEHAERSDSRLQRRVFDLYERLLAERLRCEPHRVQVLAGVPALLQSLSRRPEVTLGVATGNVEGAARLKLRAARLDAYVPVGGFGSDADDRTAIIRRAMERAGRHSGRAALKVVVIGDTPRDIEHGRRAGAATVGVATGSYPSDALRQAGADVVLESLVGAEMTLLSL